MSSCNKVFLLILFLFGFISDMQCKSFLGSVAFFQDPNNCYYGKLASSTSHPYISGGTFYSYIDKKLTNKDELNCSSIRKGDLILVEHVKLHDFKEYYLPLISVPFILVTPNYGIGSDSSLPGPHSDILLNEHLITWFVQNIDSPPQKKIAPIPIGISSNHWEFGNIKLLDTYIKKSLSLKKLHKYQFLAYSNFKVENNPYKRSFCYEYFLSCPWAYSCKRKNFAEYLNDLCNSAFVISPPGNGLDCHRTWEALLMGCYPIVKSSTLDPLFDGLPVVIVNSWEEITEDFLKNKLVEFNDKTWDRRILYADYWFELMKRLALT